VKVTDVFLIVIFKASLQPYFKLATTRMARNTLIKHNEVVVICEENGIIIANYNALIIQLESKLVAQPIVTYTTTKQQFICSNCGKTGHAKKTYHNRKLEELVVPVVPTKVVELVAEVTTKLVKQTRVPLRYPCIICSSLEHHAPDYFRKTKVQNMF
jgi:hypothetical protein